MNNERALVPQTLREINFYDDLLAIALVHDEAYVALRPITEHLGLDWSAQRQRILRDDVLSRHISNILMSSADGRQREMICLQLEYLPGWLFGITASRVKPELVSKLTRYREECFRVLWRAFQADLTQYTSPTVPSNALTQVRDLALAVAQMAEQQIEIQTQVITVNARVDRAAVVVSDLQRRLSNVERQVGPKASISDEQAAEISNQVKALAELLTNKNPGKNHYQSIFGEIYRRFGVSSYKLIRQGQYQAVLTFLDDWRKAAPQDQQPSLFELPPPDEQ